MDQGSMRMTQVQVTSQGLFEGKVLDFLRNEHNTVSSYMYLKSKRRAID